MPQAFPPDKPELPPDAVVTRRTPSAPIGCGRPPFRRRKHRRHDGVYQGDRTLLKLNVVMKATLGMIREHRAAYTDEAMISKLGVNPVRTLNDR
jgi:hypothetical protein